MNKMYKYHFRPCYQSQELLIDIFHGAESETFSSDFIDTISELKPKMTDILDLWINNELLMTFDSEVGVFILSKDIWDFAFVTADNNQEVLHRINSILEHSELFEKIEVDFEQYK